MVRLLSDVFSAAGRLSFPVLSARFSSSELYQMLCFRYLLLVLLVNDRSQISLSLKMHLCSVKKNIDDLATLDV